MSDNSKWLFPGIIIAVCAVMALIALVAESQEGSQGECQYANNFVDASGQTWSVTEIEATKTDCLEAIKVAVSRAQQSVGLGPADLPAGWSCNASSVCTKGESRVTFTLSLE